jgi:hypothetical protein
LTSALIAAPVPAAAADQGHASSIARGSMRAEVRPQGRRPGDAAVSVKNWRREVRLTFLDHGYSSIPKW